MHSKTLYLLLVLSIAVAVVTAYEDDELEDGALFDFMEKRRGRKGRGRGKGAGDDYAWEACPNKPHCICLMHGDEVIAPGNCQYEHNKGYGL